MAASNKPKPNPKPEPNPNEGTNGDICEGALILISPVRLQGKLLPTGTDVSDIDPALLDGCEHCIEVVTIGNEEDPDGE